MLLTLYLYPINLPQFIFNDHPRAAFVCVIFLFAGIERVNTKTNKLFQFFCKLIFMNNVINVANDKNRLLFLHQNNIIMKFEKNHWAREKVSIGIASCWENCERKKRIKIHPFIMYPHVLRPPLLVKKVFSIFEACIVLKRFSK